MERQRRGVVSCRNVIRFPCRSVSFCRRLVWWSVFLSLDPTRTGEGIGTVRLVFCELLRLFGFTGSPSKFCCGIKLKSPHDSTRQFFPTRKILDRSTEGRRATLCGCWADSDVKMGPEFLLMSYL